jgi:non-heme chloroperoxidase
MREFGLLVLVLLAQHATAQIAPSWSDTSLHKTVFVTVEEGVRLEVLDWGGTGPSMVLLAGSGNTAHVFDDFAPRLTGFCHVFGITRRGFGASSHSMNGYDDQRLADDVLRVLDQLKISEPVLTGHSMAGSEMTTLASEHPSRVRGLIYLDAGSDPTDFPASSPAYMQLFNKLPAPLRAPPPRTVEDRKTFKAYQEWQVRSGDTAFPESELRNIYETNPDGSIGRATASPVAHSEIDKGARKRDYSRIRVPVLAFFALPMAADDPRQRYRPKTADERAAIEAFDAATLVYIKRYETSIRGIPGARIVELPGAKHYVFLSNEAEVVRETRKFVQGLR